VYGAGAARIEILNRLKKQSKFTIYWFAIFITLGLVCLCLDPAGWFNVLDLYILMINIHLVAKGKLIGIYIGILECLFYAFICFNSALYGEVFKVLAISVPLNTFSIISWMRSMRKQKQEKYAETKQEDIVIKKLSKKSQMIYFAAIILCTGIAYVLLRFVIGQTNALVLSAIALAISIVGKVLTAKRFMDSYALFIFGNVICLFMWAQTMIQTGFVLSDITMIVYYLACFTMDIYAYDLWKAMYRKVAVNGGVILAKRKVNIRKIIKLRRQFRNLHWDKKVDMAKNS
jgi:nicotinamide mononucleotide transporter PnuC